jgi:serine/threonine protein kinase
MDHKNIVTLHEVYQDPLTLIYIMDYIEGGEIY